MGIFDDLFGKRPYPSGMKPDIDRMIAELIRIGQKEDYLSEKPGGGFNMQCRHIRTREIGGRLNDAGGLDLMIYVHKQVRRKVGNSLATHLAYAWVEIGNWVP